MMAVDAALVAAFGRGLSELGEFTILAGLAVVAPAQAVGLMCFVASSKRAGSMRDTKGLQVCQIRGIVLERIIALVPLPVVAWAQASRPGDFRAVREDTGP